MRPYPHQMIMDYMYLETKIVVSKISVINDGRVETLQKKREGGREEERDLDLLIS